VEFDQNNSEVMPLKIIMKRAFNYPPESNEDTEKPIKRINKVYAKKNIKFFGSNLIPTKKNAREVFLRRFKKF
jgi:hypothetical protein